MHKHYTLRAKMQTESRVKKMVALNDRNSYRTLLYRTVSLFPLHYFRLSHTSGMIDAQIGLKDIFRKY